MPTPPTADDIRTTVETRLREAQPNAQPNAPDSPTIEVRLCRADRELLQRIERSPMVRSPMSTILWGVVMGMLLFAAIALVFQIFLLALSVQY